MVKLTNFIWNFGSAFGIMYAILSAFGFEHSWEKNVGVLLTGVILYLAKAGSDVIENHDHGYEG